MEVSPQCGPSGDSYQSSRCYSQETQTRQIPTDYGLSFPKYFSVNDSVDSASLSLSYVSIDYLLSLILSLGRGAMLVKADMKEAYQMIPIHPQDQQLVGVQSKGEVFIDGMLPFSLHSGPKVLSAVADAL